MGFPIEMGETWRCPTFFKGGFTKPIAGGFGETKVPKMVAGQVCKNDHHFNV